MSDLTNNPLSQQKLTLETRNHSFNVGIARDFSPIMALWLGHLAFWAEKNLANNKNIHDGLVWCYDTLESLTDYFPYFTKRQIERLINNSIKEGLVVKGNYNKTTYDRTVWYALTPKAYFYFPHLVNEKYINRLFLSISPNGEMDITKFGNGFPHYVTPIPDTYPDTDPDKKSGGANATHTQISPKKSKKELAELKALEAPEIQELFKQRFSGLDITIEQLFASCQEHYEQKSLWATRDKFLEWVKTEKIEKYSRSESKTKKNETEQEKIARWKIEREKNFNRA